MKVRTRMAPSPTGEFHIGGMRTLLYNWALARQNSGEFIMRIEDTDRVRLVEGATERILQVITDYGFDWDEGPQVGGSFAPYIQSERLEIYKKHAQELVASKQAYYCFCTQQRLENMREMQKKRGTNFTRYDRRCLTLSENEVKEKLEKGEPYVIRLKVPENKIISWDDGVVGKVTFNSNDIDDQILIKSDGFPTYHLGVVVDDHLMEITHVMRGNEWLPSTPKHILIYEAFGWEIPMHFHLPNLKELGSTKKLSKRHGPVSARGFLDEGYLPEALTNYLMFLGWNPGTAKEIYTLEEFIKEFDIKKIHKTDLVAFDRKKLDWINGQYIQALSDQEFATRARSFVSAKLDKAFLIKVAPLIKSRIKKFSELTDYLEFFYKQPEPLLITPNADEHIKEALKGLAQVANWQLEEINRVLGEVIEENGFKTGDFYMDLRGVITGRKSTPPINESMAIVGKEEVVMRLKNSLE